MPLRVGIALAHPYKLPRQFTLRDANCQPSLRADRQLAATNTYYDTSVGIWVSSPNSAVSLGCLSHPNGGILRTDPARALRADDAPTGIRTPLLLIQAAAQARRGPSGKRSQPSSWTGSRHASGTSIDRARPPCQGAPDPAPRERASGHLPSTGLARAGRILRGPRVGPRLEWRHKWLRGL